MVFQVLYINKLLNLLKPMKKKNLLLVAMSTICTATYAQDLQLHYDFGRNLYSNNQSTRPKVTLTYENFSADKWGSWYYFVDVDFSRKFTESAYTEVSREFNIGKNGFAAHIEYDGGLSSRGGSFQQSVLLGGAWNGHNSDFSTTYSVQLMYKRIFKSYSYTSAYHSLQLTGVWSTNFCDNALTFSGFVDFWRTEKATHHGQMTFLTEPQLWYNLNTHKEGLNLSIGTECEISNNFIYNTTDDQSFFINPTLALKWHF